MRIKSIRLGALVASAALSALALLGFAVSNGCAPNFDPQSKVQSVRIIATRADKPYASPGDTVRLEMLAHDGRPNKAAPMKVFWFPIPCVNPPGDLYFACYAAAGKLFSPGVDLTPHLVVDRELSIELPADIVTTHEVTKSGGQYGLAIVFSMACAGHVEYVPPQSPRPNEIPFGCFDAEHRPLGPDDWVFGFSQIHAFTDRANANPVLDHVSFRGTPVDPALGITLAQCTAGKIDDCPANEIDTFVPDSSQELDPATRDQSGNVLKEQIWVDYLVTGGKVAHDVATLFDPHRGRLSHTSDELRAPSLPGEYLLWAVVRDNRGGVNWLQIPLHVN